MLIDLGKIGRAADFEKGDEIWIHVFVVVWDAEDRDTLASERLIPSPVQAGAVHCFHDDDGIGPIQLFVGKWHDGVMIQPRGVHIDLWEFREDRLRRRTAELILGTNKKEMLHRGAILAIILALSMRFPCFFKKCSFECS